MFLNKFKNEIEKRGVTVTQLSYQVRISQGDLSKVLNGKKRCFPVWRKRISEVLEMSEEELFPEFFNEPIQEAI